MAKANLTAQRLRECFQYTPETGVFNWAIARRRINKGAAAGWITCDGYRRIGIDSRHYLAHRLAWLYMTGEWPKQEIDHINGVRDDNRFCNLRDVKKIVNLQNQRSAMASNKSAGLLGVTMNRGLWMASICHDSKRIFLGRFESPTIAHEAYLKAKRMLHDGCTI